ncbi:MAG TPA: hypothetical protein VK892_08475 [Pyrinomonadaceae bacterium]|nr:hypothetical protein [Pyrinomonadaceae bacterium]
MQEQEVILNHEAEIISQPPPQTVRRREPELFENYEQKGWKFTPRLYKIFAASAIFNILFLVTVAQADLLQTKACSSPLVSKVCQVLDTVYVSSILLGTDSEFVSKDYERTELEDADITYIDVSNVTPPLNYPEGYFALANPEQFSIVEQADMNGFTYPPPYGANPMPNPTLPGNDLMNTPQILPTPNNNPIVGEIPSSPLGNNPTVNIPRQRQNRPSRINPTRPKNGSPSELSKPDANEVAENKTEENKQSESKQSEIKSETVKEIEINKKPFEDLGDSINDKLTKNELDLNNQFRVVLNGRLTADGKLDRKESSFVESKGDEQMINAAKDAIQAVGDSGILGYLKNYGVDKVNFTLVQDGEKIYAIIVSDQKTPERANTTASGINGALQALNIADKNGWKKLDENSKTLINNATVKSEGKNFVLNFAIPKPMAHELIRKSLNERAEKKNNPPSNSEEVKSSSNAKTSK